jgi:hypothetical protein
MRLFLVLTIAAACTRAAPPDKPLANKPAVAPAPKPAPSGALLAWPVAKFTAAQIAEVKSCAVDKSASKQYPDGKELPAASSVAGGCELAKLAAACAARLGKAPPTQPCIDAYSAAVKANPAFAFAGSLVGRFFGKVALVAPPTQRALAGVKLDYSWNGMGDAVAWTLTARGADVKVTGATAKAADVKDKLAALGAALDSFLPIPGPLEAVNCFDNYPEWTATLEYDDGMKLELSTHKSNLIGMGGPWQLTVGGVTYLQLGPQLPRAVGGLIEALGLPLGQPMASTCHGYDLEAEVLK